MIEHDKITDIMRSTIKENIENTLTQDGGHGTRKFKLDTAILKRFNITASDAQMIAGYHPNGYGIYHIIEGINFTTWKCSNSCD